MPQPFNNAIMTDSGAALLTRAQAGACKMEFTRIAVGDGIYTEEEKEPGILQQQNELKSPRNAYALSDISVNNTYSVKVTALISNQNPVTGEALITSGYYINEMGLYAREADNEAAPEILYSIAVVSGETGDFMPPYNGFNPVQIIQDYYATVNNSADVTILVGSGAVALAEDLLELKEKVDSFINGESEKLASQEDLDAVVKDVEAIKTTIRDHPKTSVTQMDLAIPTSGWVEDADTGGACALHTDIAAEDITEEMVPMLTILPASQETATDCGLCTTARTIDGALRVYAQQIPAAAISCSLVLLCSSGGAGVGAGYILPVASASQLGGVKVGKLLSVESDGTLSVDTQALVEEVGATDEESTEMLDSVFGNTGNTANT